jgi:hypothetical protein
MSKLVGLALAAVIAMGVTACAPGTTGNGGGESSGDGIPVVIENDISPPSSITVFIVPETGNRQRLGSMQGNSRQTFSYSPRVRDLEYFLLAEVVGGSNVRSNQFNLTGVTQIEWFTSRREPRVAR